MLLFTSSTAINNAKTVARNMKEKVKEDCTSKLVLCQELTLDFDI